VALDFDALEGLYRRILALRSIPHRVTERDRSPVAAAYKTRGHQVWPRRFADNRSRCAPGRRALRFGAAFAIL